MIVTGGYFVLRSVAIDEAKRKTRTKVLESGQLVESAVSDGLVTGDVRRGCTIDDLVVARVLSGSIVRVKIWSTDGRVLYSDDPAQVGGRYALGEDEQRDPPRRRREVEVSNLDRPENALDRGQGKLIEAYTRSGRRRAPRCCSRSTSASARSTPAHAGCLCDARSADPRRDRADRARPGPALLVADARLQRGTRSARRCSRTRSRPRRASGGASPRTCTTARCRSIAGLAYSLAPVADRPRRAGRRGRGRGRAAGDRPPAPHRARSARAARRAPPAAPRRRGPRGGDRATSSARSRAGASRSVVGRRGTSTRSRAGGARLPRRAGGRAQRRSPTRDATTVTRRADVVDGDSPAWSSPTTAAASSAERRASGGSRRGTSACRSLEELARQSGGNLAIGSSEGGGTRVELEVPAR